MNWKEFFKPTKGKIIVTGFLLLFPISFILLLGIAPGNPLGLCQFDMPCPPPILDLGFILVPISLLFYPFIFQNITGLPIGIILNILYLYLISSIIIFLYNRVRKINDG